ncbi:MAG: endonuclease domain-containing protein [Burkholderiaceae bacterium]|nr:endonuclease domain-containing protein [Burkholderiaceae bacterium]
MGAKKEISLRVIEIVNQSSSFVGKYEEESFSQNMMCDLQEIGLESPIEMALYVALETVLKINFLTRFDMEGESVCTGGILISPQVKIGNYRIDFMVSYYGYGDPGKTKLREVVVECDGTAFHERTEKERRYEKQRDRYMQKLGLKVFRFTGKEILDDPYEVAKEIIGYVTNSEENTVTPTEYFS